MWGKHLEVGAECMWLLEYMCIHMCIGIEISRRVTKNLVALVSSLGKLGLGPWETEFPGIPFWFSLKLFYFVSQTAKQQPNSEVSKYLSTRGGMMGSMVAGCIRGSGDGVRPSRLQPRSILWLQRSRRHLPSPRPPRRSAPSTLHPTPGSPGKAAPPGRARLRVLKSPMMAASRQARCELTGVWGKRKPRRGLLCQMSSSVGSMAAPKPFIFNVWKHWGGFSFSFGKQTNKKEHKEHVCGSSFKIVGHLKPALQLRALLQSQAFCFLKAL